MITEQDLREAIAECEGMRNPTTTTCVKLAALYAVLDRLYGQTETIRDAGYSFSSGNAPEEVIQYSETEFSKLIQKSGIENAFPVMDELMSTIYVINPSLYRSVIRKLTEL